MTVITKDYIKALRDEQKNDDTEYAHKNADIILCNLLRELGYEAVVNEYKKVVCLGRRRDNMACHGCNGKGWIETGGGANVHICPICRGKGWLLNTTATDTNLEQGGRQIPEG